jgi:hypothetical protein
MSTSVNVEYNIKGAGPKITINGDQDREYLVNYLATYDGIDYVVQTFTLGVNLWYAFNRSYFTNWKIEVFEANKDKVFKVHEECFMPYYKLTHIYLDSNKSFETHQNWVKVALEYGEKYEAPLVIETPYAAQFKNIYPEVDFKKVIKNEGNCYVNYVISDFGNPPRETLVPYIFNQQEIYSDGYQYPKCYSKVDEIEFARGILFGVDLNDPYYFKSIPFSKTENILNLYLQD